MIRVLMCSLLLLGASPFAAAEPIAFRCSKNIGRGDAGKEVILSVALDSDVYAGTRSGFPDLRVFDENDAETPFWIEQATASQLHRVRSTCPSKTVSLQEREGGLDVVLQREEVAPAASGLTIVTPLKDYERRVRVFGSDDGERWSPLATDGLVFDYSRYMDVANHEIRLPANDFRFFKVHIEGVEDAKESPFLDLTRKYRGKDEVERVESSRLQRRPFRMDRIDLWREVEEPVASSPKKIEYLVSDCRIEEDAEKKDTIVSFDARREPVTEFTLATSSRNFNRAVEVQKKVMRGGRDPKAEWVTFAQGHVSLVAFGGYRSERLDISFPEQRETEYRIVIHNEDNPPLAVTGVKAKGNIYQAMFLALEGRRYRLAYGSDRAKQPTYDVAGVLAPVRSGQATAEAQLGDEVSGPIIEPDEESSMQRLLNNRVLLGALVVVLVGVLGWALFAASKRINELPKE